MTKVDSQISLLKTFIRKKHEELFRLIKEGSILKLQELGIEEGDFYVITTGAIERIDQRKSLMCGIKYKSIKRPTETSIGNLGLEVTNSIQLGRKYYQVIGIYADPLRPDLNDLWEWTIPTRDTWFDTWQDIYEHLLRDTNKPEEERIVITFNDGHLQSYRGRKPQI